MADRSEEIPALDATLSSIEKVLDLPQLRVELGDLEAQAGEPGLWDDSAKAQEVTTRLSQVKGDLERVESLRSRLDDVGVLFQMAAEEADEATVAEAEASSTSSGARSAAWRSARCCPASTTSARRSCRSRREPAASTARTGR